MIFYFSGTGNSKYLANKVANALDDRLIDIANCAKENIYEFSLEDYENLGFIFPIHFYGLPQIVEDFIEKLKLNNYINNYTYGVCSMGKEAGNTMSVLRRKLAKKEINVNSLFSIKMPGNNVILYNVLSEKEVKNVMISIDKKIGEIIDDLTSKKDVYRVHPGYLTFFSFAFHKYYKKHLDTKNFSVNDNCQACGLCVKNCPSQVIKLEDDKPKWTGNCTKCLSCINRCPSKAINYGKKTAKRNRYYCKEND